MALLEFDYKFLSEPDVGLMCVICLEVAKDPKQHGDCGKLFCSECVEKNGSKPCPNCRAEHPQYFNDLTSLEKIEALRVRCDNVERGCVWEGTVGTLGDHVSNCGFTLVSCPNKCKVMGEDLQLMRRDLDDHLTTCPNRDYECELCGEKGTYASITRVHDSVCIKKVVSCPNAKCPLTMERGKMEEHFCKFTEVSCKYQKIGCNSRKPRMSMKQHEEENDKAHLHLALEKIAKLDTTVSLSLSENTSLMATVLLDIFSLKVDANTIYKGESITLKVSEFSKKKVDDETFYSEPFYTSPGGYKMRIRVYCNGYDDGTGTHVSVLVELLQGPYDDKLPWPFLGTVTVELLNQLADDDHHSVRIGFVMRHNARAGRNLGKSHFRLHSKLTRVPARNTQYLMDDTLYFRVTVEMDFHKPWLDCTHHTK